MFYVALPLWFKRYGLILDHEIFLFSIDRWLGNSSGILSGGPMQREKDPKHRVTSQPRKANHVPFKWNKCFYQCYPFLKNSVQVRFEDEIIDQQTIQCVLLFIFFPKSWHICHSLFLPSPKSFHILISSRQEWWKKKSPFGCASCKSLSVN